MQILKSYVTKISSQNICQGGFPLKIDISKPADGAKPAK